jgi:NADPH-dependent ferric siderophore reductase
MSAQPVTAEAAALAERLGVRAWNLEVVDTVELAPRVRRLRLHAPGLGALGSRPGQDLMLTVPSDAPRAIRRRYSIRTFLPEAEAVDVDVVLHGEGPGSRWAAAARPGDTVEAIGPRGKIVLDDGADWHLFAGDESGMPATLAMIEALPAGSTAIATLEVGDASEAQPAEIARPDDVDLRWLHRGGDAPGRADALTAALDAVALPNGRGHAYLSGELRVVDTLHRTLLARGLAPEQLSPKSYWRLGVANAEHGEPPKD